MAIAIDEALLAELGLGELPVEHKRKMFQYIYDTLEQRVGMAMAGRMSDDQLDEFEKFIDGNDERGAVSWLEANFPNYSEVVRDEFGILKQEISAQATGILEVSLERVRQLKTSEPVDSTPKNNQSQAG